MTIPQAPSQLTAAERKRGRHKIARRLYEALVAQNPNRAITLFDGKGSVMARHNPLPTDDGGLPHVKATSLEDRRIDQN